MIMLPLRLFPFGSSPRLRMFWAIFGYVLLPMVLTEPCTFDATTAILCGLPPEVVEVPVHTPSLARNMGIALNNGTVRALNLSHRNISAVAPNGLRPLLPPAASIQAVLLDGNEMNAVPDMSEYHGITWISLRQNSITVLGPDSFQTFPGASLNIDLSENGCHSLSNHTFARFNGTILIVNLSANAIQSFPPWIFQPQTAPYLWVDISRNSMELQSSMFGGFTGMGLGVNLASNGISRWPDDVFFAAEQNIVVDMSNNSLRELPPMAFRYFNLGTLSVDLSNNQISQLLPGVFSQFGSGNSLRVNFNSNHIHSLSNGTLTGFQGQYLSMSLASNALYDIGYMFHELQAEITLSAPHNLLGQDDLEAMFTSFTAGTTGLTVDCQYNNVTHLPPFLFNNVGNQVFTNFFPAVILRLSNNPIQSVDPDAFNGGYLKSAYVDLSNSSDGAIAFPSTFFFQNSSWDTSTHGALVVDVSNTSANLSVVAALSTGYNHPRTVEVVLSHNRLTEIPAHVFSATAATTIRLSHNAITSISPHAFAGNFLMPLQILDLANNLLSALTVDVLSYIPRDATLAVDNNVVWALPLAGNYHMPGRTTGNVLQCAEYGPAVASNCTCSSGYELSVFCGFVRCTLISEPHGCPLQSIFNRSDCQDAPRSSCVHGGLQGQYYSVVDERFLAVTQCATAFPEVSGEVFRKAFEFRPPTRTSNRLCSVCSECPTGFLTTPCSPTTNTKCTRSGRLSAGSIAAIAMAVFILAIATAAGATYGRGQSRKRQHTEVALELTERLLGDVHYEKDLVTEEKERMEQAWVIEETDLAYGEVLGEGAFGCVYRGTWGHIAVAIKVLHHPFDDLDPSALEDFNREVKFMSSIRHPNVLVFYGAGMDRLRGNRMFLVTELMERGSLKALLANSAQSLAWNVRLTFAEDVARGMRYLHSVGTVHRDLKADNCFVDGKLRVKVADFGTGKLAASVRSVEEGVNAPVMQNPEHTPPEDAGRTLSKGVGSLLWMAPEVLRGSRLKERQASALDVYSFAIVMFEIWVRLRPWEEIEEQGVHFSVTLTRLVHDGVRPQLPDTCGQAPHGYQTLMERCWAGHPESRPGFPVIVNELASISNQFSPLSVSNL
eukprot:m.159399 g.159399  ORF g.159399 m.159399 type:complete len:1116 (+) comp14529_c0_seq3:71-3418(+)